MALAQVLLLETFRREAHYYGLCLECPLSVGFRFHWHWQLKCMFSSIMTTEWLVRKKLELTLPPNLSISAITDYQLEWMLLNMISRLHRHHNLIYEVELIKNNLGSIIGHGTLKLYTKTWHADWRRVYAAIDMQLAITWWMFVSWTGRGQSSVVHTIHATNSDALMTRKAACWGG